MRINGIALFVPNFHDSGPRRRAAGSAVANGPEPG
jgi:hypothetical protein